MVFIAVLGVVVCVVFVVVLDLLGLAVHFVPDVVFDVLFPDVWV